MFRDEFMFFLWKHTCHRKVLLHFFPFLLQPALLPVSLVSETLQGLCDRNRAELVTDVFD